MKRTTKLKISDRFDLTDIRKIREHNEMRYEEMSREEVIEDIRAGAEEVKKFLNHYQDVCF